jgi:Tol biopolymer transport system component
LFSVSDTGALVYRGGAGSTKLALAWFDQSGNPVGTVGDAGEYGNPAVSPDGMRVAASLGANGARDIWIVDAVRGTSTRFTFDASNNDNPAWSPDGKSIAFSSSRTGQSKMYVKPADGSREERLLTDQTGVPSDWSRDGRFLLFYAPAPKTSYDMWVLPEPGGSGPAKPFPILATPFAEGQGRFSPDGRWIAYMSNESGAFEVYVRPFSPDAGAGASGAKWLISKGSGVLPRWRADGKQCCMQPKTASILWRLT